MEISQPLQIQRKAFSNALFTIRFDLTVGALVYALIILGVIMAF